MASGDTLASLYPFGMESPETNPATQDLRNRRPVLDFDDTTNESAVWTFVLPEHYGGGGLTIEIGYTMATATAGDIDWDAEIERVSDTDTDGFAAAISVDNTVVPATSGLLGVVSIAIAQGAEMDALSAGELGRLKITRDAAADTATGDAELHYVHIKET